MKKIMFYRPLYYMGGTEIAILNLIKNLQNFDFYIGYSDENSDSILLKEFSKYAKVVNIKNEKVEVDSLVLTIDYYYMLEELNNVKSKRNILWVHRLNGTYKSALEIETEWKKLDYIVTVSNTAKNKIIDLCPYLNNKVYSIYNILNSDEIKIKSMEISDIKLSNNLNLVTVARVCDEKGFNRMLELTKCLKDANIDFKWFIVGDNYYKDKYNEIKSKFEDYKDNFEWLGFINNPHKIVKQCDYSVLLSDYETWGLVLTEAMILGVPCITTDFPVAFEQISDKVNGIILSRIDFDSYKGRIYDIVNNKDKYKKAVENYKYDNSLIVQEWRDILNGN